MSTARTNHQLELKTDDSKLKAAVTKCIEILNKNDKTQEIPRCMGLMPRKKCEIDIQTILDEYGIRSITSNCEDSKFNNVFNANPDFFNEFFTQCAQKRMNMTQMLMMHLSDIYYEIIILLMYRRSFKEIDEVLNSSSYPYRNDTKEILKKYLEWRIKQLSPKEFNENLDFFKSFIEKAIKTTNWSLINALILSIPANTEMHIAYEQLLLRALQYQKFDLVKVLLFNTNTTLNMRSDSKECVLDYLVAVNYNYGHPITGEYVIRDMLNNETTMQKLVSGVTYMITTSGDCLETLNIIKKLTQESHKYDTFREMLRISLINSNQVTAFINLHISTNDALLKDLLAAVQPLTDGLIYKFERSCHTADDLPQIESNIDALLEHKLNDAQFTKIMDIASTYSMQKGDASLIKYIAAKHMEGIHPQETKKTYRKVLKQFMYYLQQSLTQGTALKYKDNFNQIEDILKNANLEESDRKKINVTLQLCKMVLEDRPYLEKRLAPSHNLENISSSAAPSQQTQSNPSGSSGNSAKLLSGIITHLKDVTNPNEDDSQNDNAVLHLSRLS